MASAPLNAPTTMRFWNNFPTVGLKWSVIWWSLLCSWVLYLLIHANEQVIPSICACNCCLTLSKCDKLNDEALQSAYFLLGTPLSSWSPIVSCSALFSSAISSPTLCTRGSYETYATASADHTHVVRTCSKRRRTTATQRRLLISVNMSIALARTDPTLLYTIEHAKNQVSLIVNRCRSTGVDVGNSSGNQNETLFIEWFESRVQRQIRFCRLTKV